MSTDLMTYLNFIAGLENATDQQLQGFIDEHAQFLLLGRSDMMTKIDTSIDSVFDTLDTLAKKLEADEKADEYVHVAEDAAVAAAIWSFGLSMAVFAGLAIADEVLKAKIATKENDLHKHINTTDKDIADSVGGPCATYTHLVKTNNIAIRNSAPTGLTPQTARSYLYNYMDYLSRNGGVTLTNLREHIGIARLTKDDEHISKIYDILDECPLTRDHFGRGKIREALKNMKDTGIDTKKLKMARSCTLGIWINNLKVSAMEISKAAAEAEVPPEEAEVSVLENMGTMGEATGNFTIMISTSDALMNNYTIDSPIERYKKGTETLVEARKQYKEYYQRMYDASVRYNKIAQA